MWPLFLFSLPNIGGAVELGGSRAEACRGEASGVGVRRGRGLSGVAGAVWMGDERIGKGELKND